MDHEPARGGKVCTWRTVEEASSWVTRLVQRVKHSMKFWQVIMVRLSTLVEYVGNKIEEQDFRSVHGEIRDGPSLG